MKILHKSMGEYKNPNYKKEWYEKNKKTIQLRQAEWLSKHPEKRKEYLERHRKKKKLHLESSIECFLNKALGRIRCPSKQSRREKYREDNLTLDYLIKLWSEQNGRCALTNKKMVHKFNSPFTVSIDRIDSSAGYLIGNVQLVCQSANYAKNSFTNEQFVYFWTHEEE